MERIRQEIHAAFYNVSKLCDQIFRKYPQYYPPQPTLIGNYNAYQYGGYQPIPSESSSNMNEHWIPRYGNQQVTLAKNNRNPTVVRQAKDIQFQDQKVSSKKVLKEDKKYEKKLQQLRIQRQRQENQRKKQIALKSKKRQRNTRKNQIKRDPRIAQKPRIPMSPYFLYLQEMRAKPTTTIQHNPTSNKQFAQRMGKNWRQMQQQQKKPFITAYLKEKKGYSEKLKIFYQKYPDLKPKYNPKDDRVKYSVDDPKYKNQIQNDEPQLDDDLIDELRSQEQNSQDQNLQITHQNGINGKIVKKNAHENNEQKNSEEFEWKKRKDSLSSQGLTCENNMRPSSPQVVQID